MATISRNEDVVTIATGERIDTINAVEFEKEITPILSEAGLKIIFDCTNLDYISSSGLRVILKAQKMVSAGKGEMNLIGVKPPIKKVFDMTGFTRFLTIE